MRSANGQPAARPTISRRRQRLLIFIVAYNAEHTIKDVLGRVPPSLVRDYDVEILVIDDSSDDRTFECSDEVNRANQLPFKLHVLYNPVNQGYGGNQKIGFQFAVEQGFDYVALLHGDGQYAPECLPELVRPLAAGEADAVFGSRMLSPGDALRGGMPVYKYAGNKLLTLAQNRLLRTRLSEFHSGYRVYSVAALRSIPFHLNTSDFHFDTEIIIQFLIAGKRIGEVPIPTYYGDEICHVNGLRYAFDVVSTTLRARIQDLSLLYDRKFDGSRAGGNEQYEAKLTHSSPHSAVIGLVEPGSRVLDLGCAGGYVAQRLRERGCTVTGVDMYPPAEGIELDAFHLHDLNDPDLPVDPADFDYILLLDVVEHLLSPEQFLENLYDALRLRPEVKIIASTGNVAFAPLRLVMLAGQFNYGKRGILDLTHKRLFTFSTFRRLFDGTGFHVLSACGTPAPFPLAVKSTRSARVLLGVGERLIGLRKELFAYQIIAVAQPRPSLEYLLQEARTKSRSRIEALRAMLAPAA